MHLSNKTMIKTKLLFLLWILILSSKVGYSQNITITRDEPSTLAAGGDCVVELTINKGSVAGFAKLQDELPDGLTATAIETKSASFSFENKKAKFIWMSLPADAQFKVSYKITADAKASGAKTTTGNFFYIEGNDTKKIPIAASSINISSASVASNVSDNSSSGNITNPTNTSQSSTNSSSTQNVNPSNTSTSSNSTTSTTNVVKAKTPPDSSGSSLVSSNPPDKSSSNISSSSNTSGTNTNNTSTQSTTTSANAFPPRVVQGIVYKVQVGAFGTDGAEWLKSKFNFTDPISTEQIDGLYKCVMGSFSTYAEAKEYRNKLRLTGDEGSFVVSYNNGTRIPVSEALQKTGQIWAVIFGY
jgi:hypothetical protein